MVDGESWVGLEMGSEDDCIAIKVKDEVIRDIDLGAEASDCFVGWRDYY